MVVTKNFAISILATISLSAFVIACDVDVAPDTVGASAGCSPTPGEVESFISGPFVILEQECGTCHEISNGGRGGFAYTSPDAGDTEAQNNAYCAAYLMGTSLVSRPLGGSPHPPIDEGDMTEIVDWVNETF